MSSEDWIYINWGVWGIAFWAVVVYHFLEQAEIKRKIKHMAGEIKAFTDALSAFQQQQSDAIDGLTLSITDLGEDVKGLKDTIDKLQNSPGAITPEDQALLDAAQAKTDALTTKLKAAADAAKALDEQTPPTPPA